MRLVLVACLLCCAFVTTDLFAQEDVKVTSEEKQSCYDSLVTLFQDKGVVDTKKDGLYKVIITLRTDSTCTCYEGRANIEKFNIKLPVLIKNEEGKFVTIASTGTTFDKLYDKTNLPIEYTVRNGRSPSYITNNGNLGDIFFIELLKK